MKTIGLIGGMSWESTVTYYQVINETVKQKLGGLHSAKILLYSVDFDEIERYQASGEWDKCAYILSEAALRLEKAGAELIVICTNTMHKVVPQMEAHLSVPILHIAEVTAEELKARGIAAVGLLGTKYTMTQDFYKAKLTGAGLQVVVPEEDDVETVNSVIYDELCRGIVRKESKEKLLAIIKKLEEAGARGIILGCTEIGILIQQKDTELPVFDTTLIHAEKAALRAIGEDRQHEDD